MNTTFSWPSLLLGLALGAVATFFAVGANPHGDGSDAASGDAGEAAPEIVSANGAAHAELEPVRRTSGVMHRLSRMIRIGSDARLNLPALEATVSIEGPQGRLVRHTTRTPERIRIVEQPSGVDWNYERNPISPAHFSAIVVDAGAKVLIEYPHSELLAGTLARDWNQLELFGLAAADLSKLEPQPREREAFGLRFTQHQAKSASNDGLTEVWWNAEHGLPLAATWTEDGRSTRLTLTAFQAGASNATEMNPFVRHPDFRIVDICDWREETACQVPDARAGR